MNSFTCSATNTSFTEPRGSSSVTGKRDLTAKPHERDARVGTFRDALERTGRPLGPELNRRVGIDALLVTAQSSRDLLAHAELVVSANGKCTQQTTERVEMHDTSAPLRAPETRRDAAALPNATTGPAPSTQAVRVAEQTSTPVAAAGSTSTVVEIANQVLQELQVRASATDDSEVRMTVRGTHTHESVHVRLALRDGQVEVELQSDDPRVDLEAWSRSLQAELAQRNVIASKIKTR